MGKILASGIAPIKLLYGDDCRGPQMVIWQAKQVTYYGLELGDKTIRRIRTSEPNIWGHSNSSGWLCLFILPLRAPQVGPRQRTKELTVLFCKDSVFGLVCLCVGLFACLLDWLIVLLGWLLACLFCLVYLFSPDSCKQKGF